jgi:uncharacterized protein (DUF433 family)
VATGVASQIEIDDHGTAWIAGANTRVLDVVLDKLAYGWSPEEIHFQHPHLSLAQIHSALAYYYENQQKLEEQIEREYQEADTLRPKLTDRPFHERLLALKKSR